MLYHFSLVLHVCVCMLTMKESWRLFSVYCVIHVLCVSVHKVYTETLIGDCVPLDTITMYSCSLPTLEGFLPQAFIKMPHLQCCVVLYSANNCVKLFLTCVTVVFHIYHSMGPVLFIGLLTGVTSMCVRCSMSMELTHLWRTRLVSDWNWFC